MALPSGYPAQVCSVARALEVLGERWTLLIVRDAFFGVRRFSDFLARLDIPRAVLAARLRALEEEGVLVRVPAPGAQPDGPGPGRRAEYELTDKGRSLWPVVRSLMAWGDEHYASAGPIRLLRHDADDGLIDGDRRCEICGEIVEPEATCVEPGPGLAHHGEHNDPVTAGLRGPHRLLQPVRPSATR
jgi:DNA-binding HxlR family transcriptional regulator